MYLRALLSGQCDILCGCGFAVNDISVSSRCQFIVTLSFFALHRGVRSIAINVSVWMSVGLFVCLSTGVSQERMSELHEIFRTCYLRSLLGAPVTPCNNLCISGFVDDVIFPHNGLKTDTGLESATWRIIHCDSPGGAAKVRIRGWSLLSPISLYRACTAATNIVLCFWYGMPLFRHLLLIDNDNCFRPNAFRMSTTNTESLWEL